MEAGLAAGAPLRLTAPTTWSRCLCPTCPRVTWLLRWDFLVSQLYTLVHADERTPDACPGSLSHGRLMRHVTLTSKQASAVMSCLFKDLTWLLDLDRVACWCR